MAGLLNLTPGQMGLLQAGLGMMDNRGLSTGQAISRGGLAGLQGMQTEQQRVDDAHLKALAAQRAQKVTNRQDVNYQRDDDAYQQQQALKSQISNLPTSATQDQIKQLMMQYDPAAYIKSMSGKSTTPYKSIQFDDNGQAYNFDHRVGGLTPIMVDGKQFIGSKQSPGLAGRITAAKEHEKISNVTRNDGSQVPMRMGDAVSGGQPAIWEGSKNPDFSGYGNNPDIKAAAQAFGNSHGQGLGQSTADKTRATEEAKADVSLAKKIKESEFNRAKGFKRLNSMLGQKENGKTIKDMILLSTGSGAGSMIDSSLGFFGVDTKGGAYADKLKTLEGWLMSNVPRMEGPQSEKDVELYQKMSARIGDSTIPVQRRIEALNTLESLIDNQLNYSDTSSGGNDLDGWTVKEVGP